MVELLSSSDAPRGVEYALALSVRLLLDCKTKSPLAVTKELPSISKVVLPKMEFTERVPPAASEAPARPSALVVEEACAQKRQD